MSERVTDCLRCERVRTASLAAGGGFWCRVKISGFGFPVSGKGSRVPGYGGPSFWSRV